MGSSFLALGPAGGPGTVRDIGFVALALALLPGSAVVSSPADLGLRPVLVVARLVAVGAAERVGDLVDDRVGLLSAEDAIALGQSGPVLRASGVDWDLRKTQPYLAYGDVDFNVPVYENGDVYDRYRVHMDEMRESTRIVEQCLDGMPEGAWISDDRKVVLPPRHELHTSMESLIHHFKLVTEGYRVPEGEVYVTIESPRGEMGCYVVSNGGPKPWRVKFRAPSFVALEATATCMHDALIADLIAIVGSLDTVMGEVDR